EALKDEQSPRSAPLLPCWSTPMSTIPSGGNESKSPRSSSPVVASIITGAVVALVMGAVGVTALKREQEKTRAAMQQAQESMAQAEANFALARQAVDECLNLAKDDPALQKPEMKEAKKALLRAASKFYKESGSQKPDDPKPPKP